MHCAAARVEYDVDGNGAGPRVALALGEIRLVGAFHEDAWTFLTADQADELAGELRTMAEKARKASAYLADCDSE